MSSQSPSIDDSWIPVFDPWGNPWGTHKKGPRDYDLIELYREDWAEPKTLNWRDVHPATNVMGLYWRPVKSTSAETPPD